MAQAEILAAILESDKEWVEARDIAPKLKYGNNIINRCMMKLVKSNHLVAQKYKDAQWYRVKFKVVER